MKITTNKGNWSGEDITVVVNKETRSFKMLGHQFTIVNHRMSSPTFPTYKIMGDDWEHHLAVGCRFTDGNYGFCHGDISRESKNIYEAAIKLLCNII